MNKLLALLTITISLNTFAGAGSSGGGQGVFDTNGKLHFVDVLSKDQIKALKLKPAKSTDIVSQISCTAEMRKKLNTTLYKRELAKAKNLIEEAGRVLIPKNAVYYPEGDTLHIKPLIKHFNEERFQVTAFRLPQLFDATQVDASTQIQLAYHDNGITYFQEQALANLKEMASALFIKEALRNTNYNDGLGLGNGAIEKATYYIYHGEIENFSNSEYARRYRDAGVMSFAVRMENYSIVIMPGLARALRFINYPKWMDFIEKSRTRFAPGYPLTTSRTAPERMLWSTKTGDLLKESTCKNK